MNKILQPPAIIMVASVLLPFFVSKPSPVAKLCVSVTDQKATLASVPDKHLLVMLTFSPY